MRPQGGITPGADCRLRHIKDCWRVWTCLPEEDRSIDNLASFTGLTHQKLRTDYIPMIHSMERLIQKGIDVQMMLDRNGEKEELNDAPLPAPAETLRDRINKQAAAHNAMMDDKRAAITKRNSTSKEPQKPESVKSKVKKSKGVVKE